MLIFFIHYVECELKWKNQVGFMLLPFIRRNLQLILLRLWRLEKGEFQVKIERRSRTKNLWRKLRFHEKIIQKLFQMVSEGHNFHALTWKN